ncbi:unnamed protein product [Pedinophyceae sp. YPF-701]|nr:unnamed protein product [Pedinophyceae sp. YPF-701]
MVKGKESPSNIEIYLRLRPVPRPSPNLTWDPIESTVLFQAPKDAGMGYVNNQREAQEYKFNGILGPDSKQDEVFTRVAQPVVASALDGFNGTVFAYGQTGSGKTFTITGGAERYVDRGVIPRAISHVFSEINKRSDWQFTVHISYLEIYNNTGYDLLDPHKDIQMLEDLPKVNLLEDDDGNMHFKNLSAHRATSEEEALNLLFLGDTNRTIASTPMNMASSRSHCVFTVALEARRPGSDTVRRSKLNLVDLAGSERVSKTGADGALLQEARYINVSLHFLEQVIVALQERSMGQARRHVPYRNSMMTMVLRDSLGGNCKTTMVATINPETAQLDESSSTCRFAQRVALVSNEASINEEMDPSLLIRRLKQEVRDLKDQVRLLKGDDQGRGELTQEEFGHLRKLVGEYVGSAEPDAALNLGGDMAFIKGAFQVFKEMLRSGGGSVAGGGAMVPRASAKQVEEEEVPEGGGSGGGVPGGVPQEEVQALVDQARKLKLQLQQRDNEISILVNMLSKRDGSAAAAAAAGGVSAAAAAQAAGMPPLQRPSTAQLNASAVYATPAADAPAAQGDAQRGESQAAIDMLMDPAILQDRNRAFELFRKSYRKSQAIEDNKMLLKEKYDAAKALGHRVNAAKGRINELKGAIERERMRQSAAALSDPDAPAPEESEAEARLRHEIETEKAAYREAFEGLKAYKHEIEHIQMLLEKSRRNLQKDFEQWLAVMVRQTGGAGAAPPANGSAGAPSGSSTVRVVNGGGAPPQPAASSLQDALRANAGAAPAPAPQPAAAAGAAGGAVQDPEVMRLVQPMLTGDEAADRDIIKFFQARQSLLKQRSGPLQP